MEHKTRQNYVREANRHFFKGFLAHDHCRVESLADGDSLESDSRAIRLSYDCRQYCWTLLGNVYHFEDHVKRNINRARGMSLPNFITTIIAFSVVIGDELDKDQQIWRTQYN